MAEKVAAAIAAPIPLLLFLSLSGYPGGATWEMYFNCFKVFAVIFGVVYIPLKLISR
ncbi:MAG: hypothetical protein KGH75_11895 [Rhodospirillales bacterium]|nr:hypothetical protein [Rhodospirillales bacterium]